jgi:hypothetical protein
LHFFALSVTTSLKIPGAVIPRRVFTRPGPKAAVQKDGWCGKITRPEIVAMPKLSIPWQRLNSASELRNLTATMARMNCATIVGELWSNHA